MRTALLTLVVATGACTDPSLHIQFDVPAEYRQDVTNVSLDVIAPPASEPFTCNMLAFQEVDADTVRLSTVNSFEARDQHSLDLNGIPRTGTKLLYVQGLDSDGLAVVAACVEVGDIDDRTDVSAVGEPTTVVNAGQNDPGEPLKPNMGVGVNDTRGDALGNVEVRWRVVGSAGEETNDVTTTNAGGIAQITPTMPPLAGPVSMDIRARWTRIPPQPVLGFQAPETVVNKTLPFFPAPDAAPEQMYQVGNIGPNGEVGVVALSLGELAATQRQAVVGYYDQQTQEFVNGSTPIIPNATALGMVTRSDGDHVFTIVGGSWIEIQPNGSLTTLASPVPGKTAQRIVPVSCNDTGAVDRVLVQFVDRTFATIDANRNLVNSPFDDEGILATINAAGCVSDINGDAYPVVIFERGGALTGRTDIVADMDAVRRGQLPNLHTWAFTPRVGSDPAYLLGSQFAIDGSVLTRYQLSPQDQDKVTLATVTTDQTATPPASSAGGDVDGDGRADVVAVLTFGQNTDGRSAYRLFVSLGYEHNGERLVGMSAPADASRPGLWVADFDGDGVDDLLIGTPSGFLVFRMGPVE